MSPQEKRHICARSAQRDRKLIVYCVNVYVKSAVRHLSGIRVRFSVLSVANAEKNSKRKCITNGNHYGLWEVQTFVKHAGNHILFIHDSKNIVRNARKNKSLTISGRINGCIW